MTVIQHVIQAEPFPLARRQQRIHFDGVIHTWSQTYQTRNYQIIESGMVVITRAFLIAFKPITGHFIQILTDVWATAMVLQLYIQFHLTEIKAIGQRSLWIIVHKIGHSGQRLRSGKWPNSSIPFALPYSMSTEFRMPTFGSGQSIRCRESFFIGYLFPGFFVFLIDIGQIEIPGQKTDGFTDSCQCIPTKGFKETMLFVP